MKKKMFYIPRLWFVAKRVEKRVFFSEVSGDVTNLVQEFHLAFPPGEMEGKGEGGREEGERNAVRSKRKDERGGRERHLQGGV